MFFREKHLFFIVLELSLNQNANLRKTAENPLFSRDGIQAFPRLGSAHCVPGEKRLSEQEPFFFM